MSKDDGDKPRPIPPAPAPVRSVHEWKRAKGTEPWAFAGAARACKWSVGEWVDPTYCTETEYDNAINFAKFGK